MPGITPAAFPEIFLLSEYEVTKYSKNTESYNDGGPGNSRIRVTTDFAKANYVNLSTDAGFGGLWWLRSPFYGSGVYVRYVNCDGKADNNCFNDMGFAYGGVVPALSISF